ncbi:hypothetical protein CALCODRAFT_521229, partial [Calocera cornea HHB12733]
MYSEPGPFDAPILLPSPVIQSASDDQEQIFRISARWQLWNAAEDLWDVHEASQVHLPRLRDVVQRWGLPLLALRQIVLRHPGPPLLVETRIADAMELFPRVLYRAGGNMRSFMFLRPRAPRLNHQSPNWHEPSTWEFFVPPAGQTVQTRHELHRQADHWRRDASPFPTLDSAFEYAIPTFPPLNVTAPPWLHSAYAMARDDLAPMPWSVDDLDDIPSLGPAPPMHSYGQAETEAEEEEEEEDEQEAEPLFLPPSPTTGSPLPPL